MSLVPPVQLEYRRLPFPHITRVPFRLAPSSSEHLLPRRCRAGRSPLGAHASPLPAPAPGWSGRRNARPRTCAVRTTRTSQHATGQVSLLGARVVSPAKAGDRAPKRRTWYVHVAFDQCDICAQRRQKKLQELPLCQHGGRGTQPQRRHTSRRKSPSDRWPILGSGSDRVGARRPERKR